MDISVPQLNLQGLMQLGLAQQQRQEQVRHDLALEQHAAAQERHAETQARSTNLHFLVEHGGFTESFRALNEINKDAKMPQMPEEDYLEVSDLVRQMSKSQQNGDTAMVSQYGQQILQRLQGRPWGQAMVKAIQQRQSEAAGGVIGETTGMITPDQTADERAGLASAIARTPGAITKGVEVVTSEPYQRGLAAKREQALAIGNVQTDTLTNELGQFRQANAAMVQLNHETSTDSLAPLDKFVSPGDREQKRRAKFSASAGAIAPALNQQFEQAIHHYLEEMDGLRWKMAAEGNPSMKQVFQAKSDAYQMMLDKVRAQREYLKTGMDADFETWQKKEEGLHMLLENLSSQKKKLENAPLQRISDFDITQNELLATNRGQAAFAALPLKQQTTQSAARIAQQQRTRSGFVPSTEEIMKGVKNPNMPLVQITNKQETAESAEVGKEFGKQYTDLQKASITSGNILNKLDRMSYLLQGVDTGKLTPALTEVQALAASFGIQVDKTLPAKQALRALSQEIALSFRNPASGEGMPGQLSDADRNFLAQMSPGLAQTPEGNRLIIETSKELHKRTQQVAKLARTYRTEHGHIDEGFYNQVQDYADTHPLFSGKSAPEGKGWSIRPVE